MVRRIWKRHIVTALALLASLTITAVGQNSASLTGTVQDPQGNVIPGAKVTVTDPTKNQKFEATTSGEGTFSFPTLQPGTYTLTVEMTGFKQLIKTGIIINTADRQSAGTLAMEVGEVSATIEVAADSGQLTIKKESGEQSEVITGRQLQETAVNGRNYLDLMKLIPGTVSTVNGQVAGPGGLGGFNINGTRGNMHNLTIDGTTNVDTGSNGTQHVALNIDTIAEFKVLTSNYQAEYGRSGGGDIKITTRGGGKDFHGTAYLFHRHEGLNANTFLNNADGRKASGVQNSERSLYRYNYVGYNVSGPIRLPGKFLDGLVKDKAFFFWAQEWQRQLVPTGPRQVRMPTAAELAGDFSATRGATAATSIIPIIDPQTGQPFPGNRIPANRIDPSGQAILRLFNQHANSEASLPLFNHQSQQSAGYPRREETIRVDYNLSTNTHIFARYTKDTDQQILPYGLGWTSGQNFPLTPTIFKQGPAWNASLNVTSSLSSTLTNEFIFGPSQNNLTLDPENPTAATFAGIGLTFAPPFPYAPGQFININFGGISGQTFGAITNYDRFPYKNSNTTFDFYDNISKVWGTHTSKAGIYVQRSRKDQAAGGSMTINFGVNAQNPGNTGHPYANALLGNFDSLTEPTRPVYQGQYRSTNVEWFVQDNWKVNQRLTLDYGLRFVWMQPQYDQRLQDAYFDPNLFDPSKQVQLYRRGRANGADYAFDPRNPSVRLPAFLIARIIPGSGDPFNGIGTTANGYVRGGINDPGIKLGPSLGFAFDVFGNSKTILRGGYRIAYDRIQGNTVIFPAAESAPTNVVPTFNFGNFGTVGNNSGQIALAPFNNVLGVDPDATIPMVQSFSLQVQQEIGFETVISVGYVGTLSHHLSQRRNLNYIPYGATFLRQNQDPFAPAYGGTVPNEEPGLAPAYRDAGLKFSGTNALRAEYLRRYPGYGDIPYYEFGGSSNYHSLQATVQRRFTKGLTFGGAYTWSKAMGTANADNDFTNPICTRCYDYRILAFDRKHVLAINYVWEVPKLSRWLGDHWLAKGAVDGWEFSGISQFMSGVPAEVGIGIPSVNLGQRITGSYTEGPRPLVTGPPQNYDLSATSYFDFTQFRLPDVGSVGPWPRTYLRRPGIAVTDFSIFKNFALDSESKKRLQIRLELFNAFNHAQFDNINTGLTWNIATNFSNYKENQQATAANLQNVRNGTTPLAGRLGRGITEFSGQPGFVSPNRVIQVAAKIYF
jgi:hypothetical protein